MPPTTTASPSERDECAPVHDGSSSEKVVRPGTERTPSSPCMRSASSRAIARPRPAPCASSLDVKKGSRCGHVLSLDPEAAIRHLQLHVPVVARRETRTPVPSGVCTSAFEQDTKHLCDAFGITLSSIGSWSIELHEDAVARRGGVNSAATSRASWPRSSARTQLQRARLQPRQIEQLGGQVAHPLDLTLELLEELAAGVLVEVLVGEQLEEAAEREDRRAQLVGGAGDELLPRTVQPRSWA